MESIKIDHLARTVYDNTEELGNKAKKAASAPDKSFLNDIKQKDIKENESRLIKTDFSKKHSKVNNYTELYDLKNIATNHLSYFEEVRNIPFEISDHILATGYLKSYGVVLENKTEQRFTASGKIENNKQYFDFFAKSNLQIERNDLIDLPIEIKGLSGIPSEVFKKNILITKSELFIRDFHGDHSELLKNIKKQLPETIDRILLNGKIVWSKI